MKLYCHDNIINTPLVTMDGKLYRTNTTCSLKTKNLMQNDHIISPEGYLYTLGDYANGEIIHYDYPHIEVYVNAYTYIYELKCPLIVDHIFYSGDFLEFYNTYWIDKNNIWRTRECVNRINNNKSVCVIAKLQPSNQLILIKQFRPIAHNYVLELPAGLVDKDETIEQAAIRELKEETGYLGIVKKCSPFTYGSIGMSAEQIAICEIEVDENLMINKNPIQNLDETEDIEVILVPVSNLSSYMESEIASGTLMTRECGFIYIKLGRESITDG